LPGGDVIGIQTSQPEGVVSQVREHLEAPLTVGSLEIGQDIDQIAMLLIIIPVHPPGPVALAEFEQQRRDIVGQFPVVTPGPEQGMADQDVKKEWLRGDQHGPHRQQSLEQTGRIEERVWPFHGKPALDRDPPGSGSLAEEEHDQLQVIGAQPTTCVCKDHW
jgi:hypothetical protein